MKRHFYLAILLFIFNFNMHGEEVQLNEANRMKEGHAPTPYSAKELKQGCPPGRENVYKFFTKDKDSVIQFARFDEPRDGKAVFSHIMKTEDGVELGERQSGEATWEELQSHASFDASRTTITEGQISIGAGEFDCLIYTVKGASDLVSTFWFAKRLPGPPVRMIQEKGGETIFEMVLQSFSGVDLK